MNAKLPAHDGTQQLLHLGFSEADARALAGAGELRRFARGDVMCPRGREGSAGLILEGLAERESLTDAPARRLGPGAVFGAQRYLLREPEPSVVLARSCVLALRFDVGCSDARIDAALVSALRKDQHAQRAPVIALVPGHRRAPVAELAELLASELSAHDPSVVVVVRPKPRPDPEWCAWLNELRGRYRRILLVCDEPEQLEDRGSWASTHTLVVADAARDPRTLSAPSWALRPGRTCLALVHGPATGGPKGPYRGTKQWLSRYPFAHSHHHLCLEAPASLARLARILDGRATSLVLGAGGCRGFAHIGVYRALLEAGVELDFVAGTSIGAVVGGLIAHDWDWPRFSHAARRVFVGGGPILDLRPSPSSLLAGERLAAGFRAAYGDIALEDLPIPFACTSTDLVDQRALVHERGCLWQLSKASGSIPGAAAPVRVDDRVLVDGAVLDPLPLQLPHARHRGQVIAVNLVPSQPSRRFAGYFERQPLAAWLRERAPVHLLDIMRRSLQVRASRDIASKRRGDELWIEPPLEGIGVFDCKRYDEIVERSYAYTKELLAAQPQGAGLQTPTRSMASTVPG